jgi:hypothetical protein
MSVLLSFREHGSCPRPTVVEVRAQYARLPSVRLQENLWNVAVEDATMRPTLTVSLAQCTKSSIRERR